MLRDRSEPPAVAGGLTLPIRRQKSAGSLVVRALATFSLAASFACGPNQRILESSNTPSPTNTAVQPSNTTPVPATFDQDLNAMRTADFNFIHVFRRKDGAAFDAEDKAFLNANTPAETNRRRLSDAGKAVIIGSNYRFPAEKMKLLTERFAFEDFSKPESEMIKTANVNTNRAQ